MTQSRLTIVPVSLREANALIEQWHRHHPPARGCKFCIAVEDESGTVRGVAIIGRPVSRKLQEDRFRAEVVRLATDGCANACSALYAACWRAARAVGFRRLRTYILESEPGTSLKAAGWKYIGVTTGGSWDRPSRSRVDRAPTVPKQIWEVAA